MKYSLSQTSTNSRLFTLIPYLSLFIIPFLLLATATLAQAAPTAQTDDIWYVTPNGFGTQCTIVQPCDLRVAVDNAPAGAEIRVAAGLYDQVHFQGTNDQILYINKDLTLRGGFTTADWETPDPINNATILHAPNDLDDLRVVLIGQGTVLMDGFHVRNGRIIGDGGGGIRILNGDVTILNSHIYSNTVTDENGAGVRVDATASLILRHSHLYDNSTSGGATLGGGLYILGEAHLEGNEIYQNTSPTGGGIFFNSSSNNTIINNFIYDNTATGTFGAGGFGSQSSGVLSLWHNTVASNNATNGEGGGLALFSGEVNIYNNIIAGNTANSGFTGIRVSSATVTGSHNNIFNNTSNANTLTNTFTHDPLFVDPATGDYHLQDSSPNLNAANPTFSPALDIDQQPRPFNGGFDVGADEHYPASATCFARLNSGGVDGDVLSDLQAVVDSAQAGDLVKVAGVCTGIDTAVVTLSNDITLRGGYSLTDWSNANRGQQATILDGENSRRVIHITGGNPTIDSFLLTGGQTTDNGAAVYVQAGNPLIQNSIIYGNSATNGGAIGADPGTGTEVQFSTIVNNSGDGVNLAISGQVHNSIVYGNSGTAISGGSGHSYNLIDTDPEFVDEANDDYRLTSTSPALAAADPAATLTYDIEGDPRPRGRVADIGADEANDYPAAFFTPDSDTLDVDRGTVVNVDLTLTSDGTLPDTWGITVTQLQGWGVTFSPITATLQPNEEVAVTAVVTVPNSFQAPEVITFTATSQLNPNVTTTAVIQLNIEPIRDIQFTPNYSATLLPGEVIDFTHTITNTGEFTDDIRVIITADPFGWGELYQVVGITPTATIDDQFVVTLEAGETAQAIVRVTVPEFAAAGFANNIEVRAHSVADPTVEAFVNDIVTAKATVGTRYVAEGGDDTNNNCRLPDFPCATVQRGVNQASTNDPVHITVGDYTVSSGIQVNTATAIRGGWTPNFAQQVLDPSEGETIITAVGNARHFDVTGSTTQVLFQQLTLRNGNQTTGGSMQVRDGARVTLERLIFAENSATNGGALFVTATSTANISGTQFISNTASSQGGALYIDGTVNAPNNLFVGNTANDGGAIYVRSTANVTLWHNTFDSNQATNNGGAVTQVGGTLLLRNSNLTNNLAANSGAYHRNFGTTNFDYNNVWNNSTPASNHSLGANSISANPSYSDALYRLAPLSPSLDAGDPASPISSDFEGNARPSDQGFDLGWYELTGCLARRDNVTYFNLPDAIAAGGSPLIRVSGICRGVNTLEVDGQTISQTVVLDEDLHLQGGWNSQFNNNLEQNPQPTFIDPQGQGRGIYIFNNASPLIESIAIINGNATNLGGGPAGEDAGGGIYVANGSPQFSQLRVYSSTAVYGGGLYNNLGQVSFIITGTINTVLPDSADMRVSDIARNTATFGGGLYSHDGTLDLAHTFVRDNIATDGAGVYLDANTNGLFANSVLYNNEATGDGGALYNLSNADLWQLTFYQNSAVGNGGGIYTAEGNPTIRNVIFQSNTALSGPAIFNSNGTPNIDYNYYNPQNATAVVGADEGPNSLNSNTAPGLSGPAVHNFRLISGGAATDVGDPNSPLLLDIEEDLRPSNQGFDMGADELAGCYARLDNVIYGSPQAALAQASEGDQIDVAGNCVGVQSYDAGGDLGVIFQTLRIDQSVIFEGGWNTDFTAQDEVTVLDALGLGRVVYIAPGITATLRQLHITGGDATVAGGNAFGGGIYVDQASPTLEMLHLYGNTAVQGGGLYVFNGEPLATFGNRFYDNSATDGAAIYLANSDGSLADIQNNFIYNNSASNNGGGIYSEAGNNLLRHNTLVGNTANSNGGGAYLAADSPHLRSNILANNEAPTGSGAFVNASATPLLGYNNFFGNDSTAPQATDVAFDPLFTAPALNDYTLLLTSPMANQGDPDSLVMLDYEGEARPAQQYHDIGADEIGQCYARIFGQEEIYRSAQIAINLAEPGDTVEIDGLCIGVNSQEVDGSPTTQALFVDKDLTLDGSWESGMVTLELPSTIIDANEQGRVLYVAPDTAVTVQNLHLINGNALTSTVQFAPRQGGGIYNRGTLTATIVTLYGNAADNGAGVYQSNQGELLLERSMLHSNNATNQGGAIFLNGTAAVQNNFIYENQTLDEGGGGLYHAAGTATIWHNTFFGNSAGNGEGGGLYLAAADVTVGNNIVDSSTGSGIHATPNGLNIRFNNVVNNSGGEYSGNAVDQAGGISETPLYIAAALGDFHLQDSSPGVDAGDPASLIENDIDGGSRPINQGFDIGADEIGSCLIRVVGDGILPDRDFGVVQNAIDYAEANGLNELRVARGECTGVQERNGSEQVAYITQDLTFIGSLGRPDFSFTGDYDTAVLGFYAPSSRFNALGEGRVLYVAPGANVTFQQIALVGGAVTDDVGGVLYNEGSLAFGDMFICEGQATEGGLVYNSGTMVMTGTAQQIGACVVKNIIETDQGELVSETTLPFGPGTAVQNGGAFLNDGTANLSGLTLRGNSAPFSGGAIFNNSSLGIVNAIFRENSATTGDGGGIFNSPSTTNAQFNNVVFYQNSAGNQGGGLFHGSTNSSLGMYHGTFNANEAGEGGGLYNQNSSYNIDSTIFYNNTAVVGDHGALWTAGTDDGLRYNNYYDNTPLTSNVGTGSAAIIENPLINNMFTLSLNSPAIDQANPSLVNSGGNYAIDIRTEPRPDGSDENAAGLFSPYRSDIGAYEWSKLYGCALIPESEARQVAAGNSTIYNITVRNIGGTNSYGPTGFVDEITVRLPANGSSLGWAELVGGEQTFALNWNQDATVQLRVDVPLDALTSQIEDTTLECESGTTNAIMEGVYSTSVAPAPAVQIGPDYAQITAVPNEIITYTHFVTNTGNTDDTFELIASPGPNYTNADLLNTDGTPFTGEPFFLAAGESTSVLLRVTVLSTAPEGGNATPGAIVRSTTDPAAVNDAAQNQILIGFGQGPRYVAQGDTSDIDNNCTLPTNPCATLQHAVNQASPFVMDNLFISHGTYSDIVTRTVDSGVITQTLFINKAITITGGYDVANEFTTFQPLTDSVRLTGNNEQRVIYITDGVTVTLQGLFISDGAVSAPDMGAGVYNAGSALTLQGVILENNDAPDGAGLYHAQGDLYLNSNVLWNNSVSGAGAGLYIADGAAQLDNNSFISNNAATGGGGFHQELGTLILRNNIFSNNSSEPDSSAFFVGPAVTINERGFNLFHLNDSTPAPDGTDIIADPLFVPGDFHITGDSPAVDAGNNDVDLTGLDVDGEARLMGAGMDIGADELLQLPDFEFAPALLTTTIDTAVVYSHTFTLTNTGTFADSYSISRQSDTTGGTGWDYAVVPSVIESLPTGEAITVTLIITGGSPGYVDTTTLTALSSGTLGITRTVTAVTRISQVAGVMLAPDNAADALPGETVVYTHQLTNTGNGPDSFELMVLAQQPALWDVTISPTTTAVLLPNESITVSVNVVVPPDALANTLHEVTIHAMSQIDTAVGDIATNSTTVLPTFGLEIDPATAERIVPEGLLATYTHTVRNLGNFTDTVTIDTAGFEEPTWVISPTQTSMTLPPMGSETLTVTLDVPAGTTGLTHVMRITATSGISPAIQATAVNTTTVQTVRSVTLEPDGTQTVLPSETAIFTHTLRNSGNIADSYALTGTSAQGWAITIEPSPNSGELAPNQSIPVTVSVAVPGGTPLGTVDTVLITATSGVDTAVFDSVTNIVNVNDGTGGAGVLIQPNRGTLILPGQTAVFNHTVTNLGDEADSFNYSFSSSQGWDVTITPSQSGLLQPNESAQVAVSVESPPNAPVGTVDVTIVTATSTNDPTVSDSVTDTTTIMGEGVFPLVSITPDNAQETLAGETVIYYHTVANEGNGTDTITVTASSNQGWAATVAPSRVTLPAFSSTQVEVQVVVPAMATTGMVDVTTVTAVSGLDPAVMDSATNTTTITDTAVAALAFAPDNTAVGAPGDTITYTHTLTNLGNAQDRFFLSVASEQNWATTISPASPLTLNVGEQTAVTITVQIPTTAENGTVHRLIGQAVSDNNAVIQASVTNTTTVRLGGVDSPTVYLPIIFRATDSTTPPTPTPTATPPGPTVTPTPTQPPTGHIPQCIRPTLETVAGIDLVVVSLEAVPANLGTGDAAIVNVTIRNQGTVGITPGNNFYLDLYVNQIPVAAQPGLVMWGIQGSDLGAGQSRTYSTQLPFNTPGDFWLYAQVDTDGTVNEVNEGNNRLGGCDEHRVTVTGAALRSEGLATPTYSAPRGTPTAVFTPTPTLTPTPEATSPTLLPESTPEARATATPTPTTTPTPQLEEVEVEVEEGGGEETVPIISPPTGEE